MLDRAGREGSIDNRTCTVTTMTSIHFLQKGRPNYGFETNLNINLTQPTPIYIFTLEKVLCLIRNELGQIFQQDNPVMLQSILCTAEVTWE